MALCARWVPAAARRGAQVPRAALEPSFALCHLRLSTLAPPGFLRAQAQAANLALDPRGVDYDLFEPPDGAYDAQTTVAPSVSEIPAAESSMRRAIQHGDFAEAVRLFSQLAAIDTPLDGCLDEYALAARWCAARGDVRGALPFMARVPLRPARATPTTARYVRETLLYAAHADDAASAAHLVRLAAERGYVREVARSVPALFQAPLGGSAHAEPLWVALAETLPAHGLPPAALAPLFQRAVRAQVRGRHAPMMRPGAGGGAADRAGAAASVAQSGARRAQTLLTAAEQRRWAQYTHAGDLERMRAFLLEVLARGQVPPLEHLAQFLARAATHTHVGDQSTGAFLKPLRRRLQRRRGVWETAMLRARERAGDWRGALRLWAQCFEPVRGVRPQSVRELLDAPGETAAPGTHAAAVALNSARRPASARHARTRIMPTPYACATALRAMVQGYGPQAAPLAQAYAALVASMAPGSPTMSIACFEAFIAMSSRVDVKRFVSAKVPRQGLPTMWTLLQDVRDAGLQPRATTWTLLLQGLARDRARSTWKMLLRLLQADGAPGVRGTSRTWLGVLHVLQRVRGTSRVRRQRRSVRVLLRRARQSERGAAAAAAAAAAAPARSAEA